MFAGHLGAGLLLKRASRDLGLAWLFAGAMLLDIALWLFVLLGVESVRVPEKLRTMAELRFDFPLSHGLAASLVWSAIGFAAGSIIGRNSPNRMRMSAVLAAAVFSHFILDWIVHVPELPLFGRNSARLGLGLWNHLPIAWTAEALLTLAGLGLYLRTQRLSRVRIYTLIVVMLFVTGATIIGQNSNTPPPSIAAMAGSSILMISALIWFAWWVERA